MGKARLSARAGVIGPERARLGRSNGRATEALFFA